MGRDPVLLCEEAMLRRLLLPVGVLVAFFSAFSPLHAQDPKPAEDKPAAAKPPETKPPFGVSVRSDMTRLLLGESAVVTFAVKNAPKAPEVTIPTQTDAVIQLLSGPELRPTILDGVEPKDWPTYRYTGKVPGQRIIEAMRGLTGALPAEVRDGPKNKEVDPPKGLGEAKLNLADLQRNDWVFRYLVTPREPGTFILQAFAVKTPDGQILKTDPITIKVCVEEGCSCRTNLRKTSIREFPPVPKENRPR
jgi:hypothetical protein